ncbi:hypothetical protein [Streptomyces triticisoli]|nr:hypothetical protein [Streptomyces triticisoli]
MRGRRARHRSSASAHAGARRVEDEVRSLVVLDVSRVCRVSRARARA